LSNSFGCCPQPIFDTQVAAALSGFGFSIGYASLADKILGVHVDKGETRSNWLMRPLSKSQLGYAALDVIHLLPIYIEIEKRLIQLGRKDWIDEEMSRLVKESSIKEEPNQYFRRVKGAGRLGLDELSTLQMICEWREKEAKIKDKPRSRILSDRTIIELVSKTPKSKKELFEIEGMHPILVKKYSGKLLDLIQDGLAVPKNKRPKPIAEPLPRHAGSLIKKLMKIVNIQAESLDLAPEILARRRDIEYLVRSITADGCTKLPEKIAKGWRYNVIGLPLLASSSDLV
jgi:ribonuclease D